jgi:hypothetical protein
MTFNSEKLRSPSFIFLIYTVVSVLLILIFRFIFPGSESPLSIFSRTWRSVQGWLEVFNLFPALAFSALVIPFGLASFEENYQSFSDMFFKRLIGSVITAIIATVLYGLIFFLALPLVKNYEENLRYNGELFQLAKKNAIEAKEEGQWYEASHFIGMCDRIWTNSPEIAELRVEVTIKLDQLRAEEVKEISGIRAALTADRRDSEATPLSQGREPVNSTQAISMSRIAFSDERYFDAHWLANLGVKLSVRGSAEADIAAQLASEAWNMIASLSPNQRDLHLYNLYNIKLSGYQAMEIGDWIRAYYIFQELLTFTPDDPDVKNFYAASEVRAKETAFFLDEMEMSMGESLNGALFSLPSDADSELSGRAVLRFGTLTATSDIAYGVDFEYMEFDALSNPKAIVTSRYAKLIPVHVKENEQILILTHALDRSDKDNDYNSDWILGIPAVGGIFLDVSFDELMLISDVRRGLTNIQIRDLFTAARTLGKAGYVHEIFQAEILNRLGSAFFFLPMAIFIIVIAWRYRAKQKPRYLFVLLLPVLPIVFHGFVFLYRSVFNTLGIWLVISIGFTTALVVYIVTLAVSLLVSLIVLSAQHS